MQQRNDTYQKFQDLTFQEMRDKERLVIHRNVEEFVQFADTKKFSIDDLIQMAEAGMSGQEIWNTVTSK